MSSSNTTRRTFIDEILTHIKAGQVALILIDDQKISDIMINSKGDVLCFGPNKSLTGEKSSLDELSIETLALTVDSFDDSDFGAVASLESITRDFSLLPGYFQGRFERNKALAPAVQQQLAT